MGIMMNEKAPLIVWELKEVFENFEGDVHDFAFVLQLDYREANTVFYLRNVESIDFGEFWIKITLTNGSVVFFNYDCILEYSIINVDDVIDLGVV